MTKNGKVTNASVIDRIDSVTINSSNGQKTYVSYVKVYDTSLSVKQSSISDGQENVRNDADITVKLFPNGFTEESWLLVTTGGSVVWRGVNHVRI